MYIHSYSITFYTIIQVLNFVLYATCTINCTTIQFNTSMIRNPFFSAFSLNFAAPPVIL